MKLYFLPLLRKRPLEYDSGDDSDTSSNDSAFLEDPFKAVKSHTSVVSASTSFAGTATAAPVRKRPSEYDSGDDSDTSRNNDALLEDSFKAVKSRTSVVSASTSFAGTATAAPVRKRPSEYDSEAYWCCWCCCW